MKWKHFPYFWTFFRGIHRSPMDSLHKGSVIQSFDISFAAILSKQFNRQSRVRCLKLSWCSFYATVMSCEVSKTTWFGLAMIISLSYLTGKDPALLQRHRSHLRSIKEIKTYFARLRPNMSSSSVYPVAPEISLLLIKTNRLMNATVGGIIICSRWRHQMETFAGLLALWVGKSPVTGEFPSQKPVTRSFDFFFDLRLIKRLNKHSKRLGDIALIIMSL